MQINEILTQINDDTSHNLALFIQNYGSLEYKDNEGNTLLHMVIIASSPQKIKQKAIKALLTKINPNNKNNDGDTFIHIAFKNRINMNFIISMINIAYLYDFDINSVNNQGKTILHMAVSSMNNDSKMPKLISALWDYSFDFKIKDKFGNSVEKYIRFKIKDMLGESEEIKRMNEERDKKDNHTKKQEYNPPEKKESLDKKRTHDFSLTKFGRILNSINYKTDPVIGRDEEIKKIILSLATDKKLPLLVGESGVGKTAIVNQIAYMIRNNKVPPFLKDRIIFEIIPNEIIAGTRYRGDLEQNIKEIVDFCLRNNAILFIDEIHLMYGLGATNDNKTDVASIIKTYIDRYNLKVIGTTTNYEYEKYMSKDALKRRFEIINIEELSYDKLSQLIHDLILNNANAKEIILNSNITDNIEYIIDLLIELTGKSHRRYDDLLNNPDLIISIIDRAFAYAYVYNNSILDIEQLIIAIKDCKKIYDWTKNIIIDKLMVLNKELYPSKDNIIDFKTYKKKAH